MPYIKKEEKEFYSDVLGALAQADIQSVGELNYILTKVCQAYLNQRGMKKYQFYNDVIGALECCKLELYRRKISEYEEEKIIQNGDVY